MAEYVDKQKARDLFQQKCYNVSDRINSVEVGMFVEGIMQVLDEATAADVQPVDRDSLQIVYIGRKAYHAENTIRSAIEAMDTIRDAIGHIEYTYSKHKELLSQISCCTKYGDATPEIDYYINKIKEATSQID